MGSSTDEPGLRLDITLMRDDDQHWSSANDYRIIENVVRTRYHSDEEIREQLAEFELHSVTKNGQIASFGYADNEVDLLFHSIKLTEDVRISHRFISSNYANSAYLFY